MRPDEIGGLSSTTTSNFLDSAENLLSSVFSTGFDMITYALSEIWPYLIVVAVLFMFWRVAKSFFRK